MMGVINLTKRGDTVTVEPIANGCLRVWLTDEEIEQWGLAADAATGRIRRLVRRISAEAGWTEPIRVTAELIPVDGGGVLLISPSVAAEETPLIYHLRDTDALLDLIRRWGRWDEPQPLCSLYTYGEEYDLVVYAQQPLTLRQQCLLLEYGDPVPGGDTAAARCGEYGRLVQAGMDLSLLVTECVPTPPEPPDPVQ